jgi:N-acetylneuraminic acid mutarotase
MTRNSPFSLGVVCSVLGLAACSESTTEPAAIGHPLSNSPVVAVTGNRWVTRAGLHGARFELATAAVTNAGGQSTLYAIAGRRLSDNMASRRVDAYNVATNGWTDRAQIPIALYSSNGAGAIDGKIYVSGGVRNSGYATRHLYMYDPATNAWTQKSSMPAPGYSGVTGVINGQLYVFTGCYGEGICDPFIPVAFYRYNPVTNRWTRLSTPSNAHRDGMGGTIGGKFFLAGGRNSFGQLDVYDPATDAWTIKAFMPSERSLGAGAVLGGKLYVMGGIQKDPVDGSETAVAATSAYDPIADTWTAKAPMPAARYGIAASRIVVNEQERI